MAMTVHIEYLKKLKNIKKKTKSMGLQEIIKKLCKNTKRSYCIIDTNKKIFNQLIFSQSYITLYYKPIYTVHNFLNIFNMHFYIVFKHYKYY